MTYNRNNNSNSDSNGLSLDTSSANFEPSTVVFPILSYFIL